MSYASYLLTKTKCFLGFHEWENIEDDSYVWEILRDPEVDMVCYRSLHKCKQCHKEEHKGMGCVS